VLPFSFYIEIDKLADNGYIIVYMKMKPYKFKDSGWLYTAEDFILDCKQNCLTDDDGYGCYATDKEMSDIIISPSDILLDGFDNRFTSIRARKPTALAVGSSPMLFGTINEHYFCGCGWRT
jgi:hypothetical protein